MNFRNWLRSQEIDVVDTIKSLRNSLWRYGNYCGPGPKLHIKTCKHLSSGDPLPQPVNQVDAHCKNHDVDYCKCGVGWTAALPGHGNSCSRRADRNLADILDMVKDDLPPNQRKAANIISGYFNFLKR